MLGASTERVIQLCELGSSEEREWDHFVQESPEASHYHLSGWKRVIEQSYSHRCFHLRAHENGKTTGILPLALISSAIFGTSLVSLPFLDYGGICSNDKATATELFSEAVKLFKEWRADSLDLRQRYPTYFDQPSQVTKVTLTLDLAGGEAQIWQRFPSTTRNRIRKALKSDMSASWAGIEGLSDFYSVFATNMRDLGSPVHSRRFFEAVLNVFPSSARLVLVRNGGVTVGGALCLLFRDTILVPWPSSDRRYFSLCPNNLLYWEIIRWGCEKGYQSVDFGRSSPDSGPYRFKKQWDTVEQPLHWQLLSRTKTRLQPLGAFDSRYQWAIKAWRHLPLTIANAIGPLLRKQISS